jgi:hypothetical protein
MVRTGGHRGRQPHFDHFVDLSIEWVIRLRFARRSFVKQTQSRAFIIGGDVAGLALPLFLNQASGSCAVFWRIRLPKRSEALRSVGLARVNVDPEMNP